MNIAFDAKRYYKNFTGIGNFSRALVSGLQKYSVGNEYLLYCPKRGGLAGALWRTFGIAKQCQRDKVDVYHGLSNELPVGLKCPSIVTIHDVAFKIKTQEDMYGWCNRLIYNAKWRYACKHATHIVAISEHTKRDVMKFYGVPEDKITVIYQPVAEEYYGEFGIRNSEFGILQSMQVCESASLREFMLYVGTVNARKNLLNAVKALELIPLDIRVPLLVVGGGSDYKRKVQQYVKDHKLEEWEIFPEKRVSDEELKTLYATASLFVYPSFYEGFGLPVVEAQLCGCPVLTSNVSSLPEAAGPHSLLVDPYSVSDIAEKMTIALTDKARVAKMKVEGREYAMRMFHPSDCAQKHLALYKRLALKEQSKI